MQEHSLWFTIPAMFAGLMMVLNAGPGFSQERATAPSPNTVLVGADGKFEADPDTVLVQFNISSQEEKLPAASDRAKQSAEQVRELLRKNGLDPKQAQVGQFSVMPVYDYKTAKRKLVGYRVDTNISIKMKDFSKVPAITQGLTDLDVTDNQSVSYILEDIDAAKVKAVQDALRRAQLLAEAVATGSGHALGSLSYASVDTFEQLPPPRPMMMKAMAAPMAGGAPAPTEEFTPQKTTVTAHVNALYNFK